MGSNISFLFNLCILLVLLLQTPAFAEKKSYVVYLGGHSHGNEITSADLDLVTNSHYDLLGSYIGSEKAREAIFYSYTRYINGFAAILEEEEAMELKRNPNVISVFLNKGRKLHTTRSWEFMNLGKDNGEILADSIWKKAKFGEDIIIATLDTGVWPESRSFNDEGMKPVPSRWKGSCYNRTSNGVNCNKKLIGAKFFNKGFEAASKEKIPLSMQTPRDVEGHGTHTLSTAGGRFVHNVTIDGYLFGTAKGGAPLSHVASYKVCWLAMDGDSCFDADIMAAFDAGIHDGVDVFSLSIGSEPNEYMSDAIAIGSFHAVKNGIPVICSAGNDGPSAGTVSNVAPWIFTVAASTIDREVYSTLVLGNKMHFKGASYLSNISIEGKMYPLIHSAQAAASNFTSFDAESCLPGSLNPQKVKGKIVVCLRGMNPRIEKSDVVQKAGGVGMILISSDDPNELIADAYFLPTIHIPHADSVEVLRYINTTKNPVASLSAPEIQIGAKPSPRMASFSSQGPNLISKDILKPDITAPGVNVLAALSEASEVSATQVPNDTRKFPYYFLSGTSMACPHVAGVVGLLRALYPHWSPSAIKSAIMTTSRTKANDMAPIRIPDAKTKATPFNYGSGHIRPNRAMNPGLVYDLTSDDYLYFLCGLGYNSTNLLPFTRGEAYKCPKSADLAQFNYPTLTVARLSGSVTISRTLKNVGSPGTYKVKVQNPEGILVNVEPTILQFSRVGEEKKFHVTIKAERRGVAKDYVFGGMIWSDGVHFVRSPIVVKSA